MYFARSRCRFAAAWLLAALTVAMSMLPTCRAAAATTFDCTGFTCTEVTFAGGGGLALHGTVIGPAGSGAPTPGMVLVGGAGPGPRTEYQYEARAFAAAGITTLVYDKRTAGYSFAHRDFALLADDAAGAAETLRRTAGVQADQVGLWGFSEGAWVAPLAASHDGGIAFLVTLGAPGFSPLRSQTWSLATALRHRGDTGSLAATVAGPAARLLGDTGLFPEANFDPLPALRTLRIPVLALWGDHDVQVPPAESAAVLRDTLGSSPSVTISVLPGSAHNARASSDGFDRVGPAPGPDAPRGAFVSGYFDTVTAWVHRVADGRPPSSSATVPPRQTVTSVDPGRGWWSSAGTQLAVVVAVALVFVGYLLRSFTGRRIATSTTRYARLLACTGLVSVIVPLLYVVSVLAFDARTTGPIVASRPLIWLILQLLALATAALLIATAVTTVRTFTGLRVANRFALGTLLCAGCLWAVWAAGWGLFSL